MAETLHPWRINAMPRRADNGHQVVAAINTLGLRVSFKALTLPQPESPASQIIETRNSYSEDDSNLIQDC